jgi:hypothetical protein
VTGVQTCALPIYLNAAPMGLLMGQFWLRIFRFNWFGHQSRFDVPLPAVDLLAPPVTGHLLSSFIMFPPFVV